MNWIREERALRSEDQQTSCSHSCILSKKKLYLPKKCVFCFGLEIQIENGWHWTHALMPSRRSGKNTRVNASHTQYTEVFEVNVRARTFHDLSMLASYLAHPYGTPYEW